MINIYDKDLGRMKLNPRHIVSVRLVMLEDGRGYRLYITTRNDWKYDEDFTDGVRANLRLQEIEEAVDKLNGGSNES
jgi:hypothetical protein